MEETGVPERRGVGQAGGGLSGVSNSSACLLLGLAACAGNALYALGEPGGLLKLWSPALVAAAMTAFLIVHGRACYSPRQLLLFTVTVFLIGWLFETLSVLTGFPFGSYHYTEVMGPFVGHVPVSVMPAYCVMGYVSWSMARILLGRMDGRLDTTLRFAVPVAAAVLMVVWDLSMDPLRATVEKRWIWLEGGPHFGVPVKNYLGWALVTWLMFQAFAAILTRTPPPPAGQPRGEAGRFWLSVPLMYLTFAVEYLLNPLFADTASVVTVNGADLPASAIFAEVAVLAATTMLPAAFAAAVIAWRHAAIGGGFEGASEVLQTGIGDRRKASGRFRVEAISRLDLTPLRWQGRRESRRRWRA